MQYKVPQDVQREDTILWFITLRQLILLLIGGGVSYFLYVQLAKSYTLNTLETGLLFIPFLLSIAFAFLKIKGMTLMTFIVVCLEQFFFLASRRYWSQEGNNVISMTTSVTKKHKKHKNDPLSKNVSSDKIKKLALALDT